MDESREWFFSDAALHCMSHTNDRLLAAMIYNLDEQDFGDSPNY